MRLAFDNGQVFVPLKQLPLMRGLGQSAGVGLGDDFQTIQQNNPDSIFTNMVMTIPSAAQSGAATANMLGGSTKADIIGGVQSGLMMASAAFPPAAPFLLAASAEIAVVSSMFKGCGVTCTQSCRYCKSGRTSGRESLAAVEVYSG